MGSKLRTYWFPVSLLMLMAIAIVYFTTRSVDGNGALPVIKAAPDFTLQDLNGNPVQASDNAGKVVLMEFMFTSCPDICPVTTYKMSRLQTQLKENDTFGSKVQFVTITFDPERDTPEVLREYADRMEIDLENWQVLRGEERMTHDIAAKYDVSVLNMGEGQFVHNVTSLQLIDAKQRIRKVYSMGDEMDNEEIMADITALLGEMEQAKR